MKHESAKYLFIFLVLVIIDQISKYLIRFRQPADGFYICNKGIAFGIRITFWECLVFFIFIIIMILLNFKFRIFNFDSIFNVKNWKFNHWNLIGNWKLEIGNFALALILSGAISNIIDRLYFGCVIDFIDLKIWPVFNLADSFIVLGVIMIIIRTTDSH